MYIHAVPFHKNVTAYTCTNHTSGNYTPILGMHTLRITCNAFLKGVTRGSKAVFMSRYHRLKITFVHIVPVVCFV